MQYYRMIITKHLSILFLIAMENAVHIFPDKITILLE